jgi:hypothetical protein
MPATAQTAIATIGVDMGKNSFHIVGLDDRAAAVQAQNQASQGRDLSTSASLRALRARTPEQAWARRAAGEGVKFCPRAG